MDNLFSNFDVLKMKSFIGHRTFFSETLEKAMPCDFPRLKIMLAGYLGVMHICTCENQINGCLNILFIGLLMKVDISMASLLNDAVYLITGP